MSGSKIKTALFLIPVFTMMMIFAYGQSKPDSIQIRHGRKEKTAESYYANGRLLMHLKQMNEIMKDDPAALKYLNKARRANKLYVDIAASLTGAAMLGCLAYNKFNVPVGGLAGFTVDVAFVSFGICLPVRWGIKHHVHDAVSAYNRDCATVDSGP